MNNFRIEIQDNEYRVYFEQKYIGRIEQSEKDSGFYVMPDGVTYSGFFKELDTAIMELVFHTYAQHKQVPHC
jgi:hypothetical protein